MNENMNKVELNEFDDLLSIGVLKKKVLVGKHEFVLKTLNFNEFSNVSTNIKEASVESQLHFLVESIDTIDGKVYDSNYKLELLKKMQVVIVNKLMASYAELMEEQASMVNEVKKNS